MSNDCWESEYCSALAAEVFCGAVQVLGAINKTTFWDLCLNNRFYAVCLSVRLPLPTFDPFSSFFPSFLIYLFGCLLISVTLLL
jgi:hypothetical protein